MIRYPGKKVLTDWANKWIKWIGQLYAINNQRLAIRNDPEKFQIKQHELEQAVLNLQQRSMEKGALPEQQKIMTSLQNHWQGLTLFVDNPDIQWIIISPKICSGFQLLGEKIIMEIILNLAEHSAR